MLDRQTAQRFVNLYEASRLLSEENKSRLQLKVPVTIYVQDPMIRKSSGEPWTESVDLAWELGLADGPTSARVAVVDYDADSGRVQEPARLHWDEEQGWRFLDTHARPVDEKRDTWQFRQVNAWAVVQRVLQFFENSRVMGRAIPWGFEGNRLIVVPHAGYCQNAFYDRNSKALQFYHCGTADDPVYTCLSHDIVAHETGHAILDGIRPYCNDISSIQTSAFHEFVADLTAILTALRNTPVRHAVAEQAEQAGGKLDASTVINYLAEQFGSKVAAAHGAADRYYLRNAANNRKIADMKGNWSAHDWSEVLTGALFEILKKMTLTHYRDGDSMKSSLNDASRRLVRLALRALDFCPPVDVQFADYARAFLHADELAYPEDHFKYREIARKVFERRGILSRPDGAPDRDERLYNVHFHRYDIDRASRSRTAAYLFLHENRERLKIPDGQDFRVVDLYDTDKEVEARRRLPREIIVEYLWSEDVVLQGARFGKLQGKTLPLLCGGTLVFDGRGNVLHLVRKPGTNEEEGQLRRDRLLDYVEHLMQRGLVGLAEESSAGVMDIWQPPVVAQQVEGTLRLRATPQLWHSEGS